MVAGTPHEEKRAIRDSDWRRIYILQHPLLVSIATTLLMTGVLLSLSPPLFANTVIARALPAGLEYPWDIDLVCGSALILAGVYRLDNRLEAAGAVMSAAALAVWVFVYLTTSKIGDSTVSVVVGPALASAVVIGLSVRGFTLVTAPEVRPWLKRS